MCGIAGCVARPGDQPDAAALRAMADQMAPRGPDGVGIETWRNVGLVHRRLAIVDPTEAGAQPMSDPEGRWTITYNGEVYNHMELRAGLDVPWKGHSDTETLLHAVARSGAEAIRRCNGPLALAALDRAEGRLLLARDRFGKKPLYVTEDERGLWFASELRALLAAGIKPRPNVETLAHGAFFGWANGSEPPLAGVVRLAPGTLRWIDTATRAASNERWFEPTELVDRELEESLVGRSPRELTDLLETALQTAVQRRLMSDVPVGTLLSGGLDSSLVTALAAREHPGLVAFTAAIPADQRASEAHHAKSVAARAGVPLEAVDLSMEQMEADLVSTVSDYEYPLTGAGTLVVRRASERARDLGFKVLLTGEASDELFAGYDHRNIAETRAYLPPHLVAARGVISLLHNRGPALASLLRRSGLRGTPTDLVPRAQSSVQDREEVLRAARRAYAHHPPAAIELEAALLADITASSFGHLLARMDKLAMAASIETRLPFLDPDVVRLAWNLPLRHRAGRRPKAIIRALSRRHLPPRVALRSKQIDNTVELRRRLERTAGPGFLADGLLRETLGLSSAHWSEAIRPDVRGGQFRIWTAEIWARLFLEGRSVEQVESELWG